MKDVNRRLVKNTIAQYIRIVISAVCGLVAVRIVLKELGLSDYGIYTLIGGLVAFLGVLNSAMIVSTQRFISVEIANGNIAKVRDIYSTSVYIHFVLSIIILLLSETLGLYAINFWLNFPSNSLFAVNIVYQCTILTFILNVLSVPQQAMLIAYEKIYIAAIIGIIESILRLTAACILIAFIDSKLIYYSILILIIAIIIRTAYKVATTAITGIKYHKNFSRDNIKSFAGFAWWNLFGGVAMIGKVQGVNIILNLFFGTVINATYGIANQINSQLMIFSSSIFQSSNSQTIQAWKNNDFSRLDFLIQKVSRIAFMLFLIITIPIYILTDDVFNLWLGKIPEYADIFLKLMLLNSYIELFSTPMMFVIQATGKVKKYFIVISSILLLILPISYLFLKWGYPPQTVLSITIVVNIFVLLIRGKYLTILANYSATKYFTKTIFPCIVTIIIGLLIPVYIIPHFIHCSKYIICAMSEIISISSVLFLVFSPSERKQLLAYAKSI